MPTLIYSKKSDRYNDFHCGTCFEIKVNGKWKSVRIELNRDSRWLVVDEDGFYCYCSKLEGSEIKI